MPRYFLIICLLFFALVGHAQPGTGGPAPSSPPPAAVPLDGGASLLLAGGAAYGLRRLRQLRRRS